MLALIAFSFYTILYINVMHNLAFVAVAKIESQVDALMTAAYIAIVLGDISCELLIMCERIPLVQSADFTFVYVTSHL